MIVRNEGALLGNCLDSVQGLIDELVVIDTGSTDNTIEIARNYGARVSEFRWTEDFSAARNHALQMATAAWILVLDADETLSRQDHSKLAALVSGGDADAWSLVQRTYGNNLIHNDYTVAQMTVITRAVLTRAGFRPGWCACSGIGLNSDSVIVSTS